MKTAVEELSPTRVRLSVEVTFEELKPSLDKAYREVSRQVRIPGFRPWRVPPRVIDMRIGRGAVLSEASMAQSPLPTMFPARNRIISGLSRAVVIVEAAEKSGALITASHAAEQGRPVLAVPGPVDSTASGGTNALIREGYRVLHLITFFTAGPKEARAWTVTSGSKAPRAAGTIHTDFEKGFIRAETIAYDDYVALSGEAGARDAGKLRLEGKDYAVKDGDVFHFRFNV